MQALDFASPSDLFTGDFPSSENIANLLEMVRNGGSGSGSGGGGGSGGSGGHGSHEAPFTGADRNPGGPTAHIHKGISQARDFDDPPGLQEKTEYLLREWVQLYHAPSSGRDSTKAFTQIVYQVGRRTGRDTTGRDGTGRDGVRFQTGSVTRER